MATKKTTKKATGKTAKKTHCGQENGAQNKSQSRTERKSKSYSPQTGRTTGQELQALQRLDTLTKTYQAEGMSPQDARQRALDELRNNPRRDWRHG